MKWMVDDIYKLRQFNAGSMDLYDLYYLLKTPQKTSFAFEETHHSVQSTEEEGTVAICYDGTWFRTIDDFFQKAELDGELLTTRYEELYDFEVE